MARYARGIVCHTHKHAINYNYAACSQIKIKSTCIFRGSGIESLHRAVYHAQPVGASGQLLLSRI